MSAIMELTPQHIAALRVIYQNHVIANAPGGMGQIELLNLEGEARFLNVAVVNQLFEERYVVVRRSRLVLAPDGFTALEQHGVV